MSASRPIAEPAGLLRRLAIMTYDSFLLLALLFLATTPLVFLNGGQALNMDDPIVAVGTPTYLTIVTLVYYSWFWTRGQTLGMRAWRTCVTGTDGKRITYRQASVRFFLALLSWAPIGLGYLWSVVDSQGRTWHDIGSGTRLVVLPKGRSRKSDDNPGQAPS